MSWEESDPEFNPCPCGKDFYSIVHSSDDWGRYDESWAMRCPRCNKKYDLYTYYTDRKGIIDTCYAWVPKSLLMELKDLRELTEGEKINLHKHLITHYSKKWLQYFNDNSKKAIWSQLTDKGRNYPSLSTFYSHIRYSGLKKVLEGYLHYKDVLVIIQILNINDINLKSLIERIQNLERELQRKERHIRNKAVL